MELSDDQILRCPDCNTLYVQRTILSAMSGGIRRWTDGYWTATHVHVAPLIVRCLFCGEWLPVADLAFLFPLPLHPDYGALPVIGTIDECMEPDYVAALESPRCERIEKELRTRLWWRQNDERRAGGELRRHPLTPEIQRNLDRLIELLGSEDLPLHAEALRELGDFDEALSLLSLPSEDGLPWQESEPGRTIRRGCEERSILPLLVGSGRGRGAGARRA